MNIAGLLRDLRDQGIELRLTGEDQLVCNAPKALLTPEICATIKAHKGDIVAFLKPIVKDAWSPLVPIQTRGALAPFFCIHGVGGNVLNYSVFARYLGPDQPVYGLQSVGLDGLTPPVQDVPSMAANYIEQVRAVQPAGPYHLGGGSMGGMVALEMARQLKAAGEEIGLLIFFDTIGPNVVRKGRLTAAKAEGWRAVLADMRQGNPLSVLQARVLGKWKRHCRLRLCRRCLATRQPIPVEHRLWYIEEMNYKAMYAHQYGRYDGEIVLVRGRVTEDGTCLSDPMRGWTGLTDRIRVFPIAGDHETLIEQPELGRILANCLEEARNQAGGTRSPA